MDGDGNYAEQSSGRSRTLSPPLSIYHSISSASCNYGRHPANSDWDSDNADADSDRTTPIGPHCESVDDVAVEERNPRSVLPSVGNGASPDTEIPPEGSDSAHSGYPAPTDVRPNFFSNSFLITNIQLLRFFIISLFFLAVH